MGVSRGLLEQGNHVGFFGEVAANCRTIPEETYVKGGIWRLNALEALEALDCRLLSALHMAL